MAERSVYEVKATNTMHQGEPESNIVTEDTVSLLEGSHKLNQPLPWG